MAELRWPTTHANNLTAKAEITAIRRPAGRLADAFPAASGHTVAKLNLPCAPRAKRGRRR
jgi:hypothetical protein